MVKFILFLLSILFISTAGAQTDSLIFDGDIVIIGEIKNLNRGVIIIETDYSDSDFKIEWSKVKEIYGTAEYIISLSDGERMTSTISTHPSDSSKVVLYQEGTELNINISEVVYIKPVEEGFLEKLSASVDLGFTLTKANNLKQFSLRSNLGYLTNKWSADASLDAVRSAQNSIASISRTDATVGFNYFLPRSWFALVSVNFLQNDEQKLKLRSTPKVGIGNYLIQTNSIYWGVYGGAAWNNENYTDPTIPNRNSAEANIGTELNLFDMGDLSLLTTLSVYKSISEGKRIRATLNLI